MPYGGLLAGRLVAGETLLVNGATGAFGSAGVQVGIAMGAARVVATGRNAQVLADLERRFGGRVRTVKMSGNEEEDRRQMQSAAGGPIDIVLDLLPPEASPSLGAGGRAGGAALRARHPDGRHPGRRRAALCLDDAQRHRGARPVDVSARRDPAAWSGMVRSGQIRLDGFAVTEFPLEQVNEAVAHAAAKAGPFKMTVVRP